MASELGMVLVDNLIIGYVEYNRSVDVPNACIYPTEEDVYAHWHEICLEKCTGGHPLTWGTVMTQETCRDIRVRICPTCSLIIEYQEILSKKLVPMNP